MDASIKIPCTLVPVTKFNLLLPNSAIAEVIVSSEFEVIPDTPRWLYGVLNWQNKHVPVIEFDKIDSTDVKSEHKKSIILIALNPSLKGNTPYIGILSKSIPQVIEANSHNVDKNLHPKSTHSHAKSHVIAGRKEAIIPNMESLTELIESIKLIA